MSSQDPTLQVLPIFQIDHVQARNYDLEDTSMPVHVANISCQVRVVGGCGLVEGVVRWLMRMLEGVCVH